MRANFSQRALDEWNAADSPNSIWLALLLDRIDREAREECAAWCAEIAYHKYGDSFKDGAVACANKIRLEIQRQQPEAPAEGSGT